MQTLVVGKEVQKNAEDEEDENDAGDNFMAIMGDVDDGGPAKYSLETVEDLTNEREDSSNMR